MGRKHDVTSILARNLKALMEDSDLFGTQMSIARKSGVAQTSVGFMLNPDKRQPSKSGRLPSPTVENVEKVAKVFGKEAWQLLHPDPATAPLNASERSLYEKLMRSVQDLREMTEPGDKPARK
jgi:hypothetical protein